MSIKLMSHIWDHGPEDTGERFVLLAIADNANDDGVAYPSAATIARKVVMDERSVRRIVKRLADQGWLTVKTNAGPKGCNLFTVHRRPLTVGQGDIGSGGPSVREPLTDGPGTPDRGSAEPSGTIREPSEGGALTLTPPPDPPSKPSKEKRACQIGDWRPSEMAIFEAAVQIFGTSKADAIAQAEQVADAFVDHALDKGRTSKDWNAAWRSWVKKEAQYRHDRKRH